MTHWVRCARVNGAECDEEIGAITDLYMERVGRPALLFDEIPGYPPGFRVLANVTTSPQRVAVTLGIPRDLSLAGMVQHCRRFHGALPGIKPRVAGSGPLLENVATGADIDMLRFPTPKWHEDDGGRYLGTGCAVVMQDPDSDWINVGCYRVMVHDRNTLGIMITAGKQGPAYHGEILAQERSLPGGRLLRPRPADLSDGRTPRRHRGL